MRIAIHQPNYIPWLGFFRKMMISDIFVFFDDIQFEKGGLTNRVALRIGDQQKWLTQPINKRGILDLKISDVSFSLEANWRERHFQTIKQNYCRRPFYGEIESLLKELHSQNISTLVDFNINAIKIISVELGIKTKTLKSSDLMYLRDTNASEKLASICKNLHGDIYCSGNGGKKYNDLNIFSSYNIAVSYDDNWRAAEYDQGSAFIPGLSIIDVIANVGLKGTKQLLCCS
jgi:hypothetical protein